MVTKLEGPATVFLPFNQGDDGGAGNPREPAGGHRTAYLWEQVWARESWLEILGRYLIAQRDKKKQIEAHLPALPPARRDPQTPGRGAARRARAASTSIQHSAGSGKTNSIAWTAHFLAELHDAEHKKVFDTVLVVSDRNVIDSPASGGLFDFERTTGVVATIKGEGRARAASWPRPSRATRRSSSARSRPSRSRSRPCASWPPPRASASP
jgi:type I restriction enzyme R subunit